MPAIVVRRALTTSTYLIGTLAAFLFIDRQGLPQPSGAALTCINAPRGYPACNCRVTFPQGLIGEVLNIQKPSDIEGVYTAGQAGVAVVGGAKVAELKNSKGVVLKLKGKQVGLEFALDLSGMEVKLKK